MNSVIRAIAVTILSTVSISAMADEQSCLSAPPAPMKSGQASKPVDADGLSAPIQIQEFDLKIFGISLGQPYSNDELLALIKAMFADYGIGGLPVENGGHAGLRYNPYSVTVGDVKLSGFYDKLERKTIIYGVERKVVGMNTDWNALSDAMRAKFGKGFTAEGVNRPNYAFRFRDGFGGWYAAGYGKCLSSADCEAVATMTYRNKFMESDAGGVCITEYYEFNVKNIAAQNDIQLNEASAKDSAAKQAADRLKLVKPKI